jgi:5-methylcytosine-specific restriction endonuclease McrA
VVHGRLTPEVGALLVRALDAARERLYQRTRARAGSPPAATDPATALPTGPQQRADALALLAETALHHELDPGAPGERYQVVVHVDADTLVDPAGPGHSVLDEGAHVPAGTAQRLACDASRVIMRHDAEGRAIEVGARTRTIPPALRRALLHRDRTCRFPGCPVRVAEGHHVRHWAQGGPTTLSNLVLLCRRHHRAVHEEGYRISRAPDGTLDVRRPDGRLLPEVPPSPPPPVDPVVALQEEHAAPGLGIHARTSCARWLGARLDVGWTIDVLHPRANGLAAQPDL